MSSPVNCLSDNILSRCIDVWDRRKFQWIAQCDRVLDLASRWTTNRLLSERTLADSTVFTSNWSARVISSLILWKRLRATTEDCSASENESSFSSNGRSRECLLCTALFWWMFVSSVHPTRYRLSDGWSWNYAKRETKRKGKFHWSAGRSSDNSISKERRSRQSSIRHMQTNISVSLSLCRASVSKNKHEENSCERKDGEHGEIASRSKESVHGECSHTHWLLYW